jgi:hypothetical protein
MTSYDLTFGWLDQNTATCCEPSFSVFIPAVTKIGRRRKCPMSRAWPFFIIDSWLHWNQEALWISGTVNLWKKRKRNFWSPQIFSMSPRNHVDRFLIFLSPKMACLDTFLYPSFGTVSLSAAPFLKGWPFQYSETSRWKYLDTFFVKRSTRDIGHFHLQPILPQIHVGKIHGCWKFKLPSYSKTVRPQFKPVKY